MRSIDRRQLLAILLAVLMLFAAGVSASDHLAVGSQHSTETEFSNAESLDNLTVDGSGESARLVLASSGTSYDFEDEAADSGVPDDFEVVQSSGGTHEVTSARAASGTQSYHATDDAGGNFWVIRPNDQPISATTDDLSTSIYQVSGIDSQVRVYEDGNARIFVGMRNGDLKYVDSSGDWVVLDSSVDAGEWVDITIQNIDAASDTYEVSWSSPSSSGTSGSLTTYQDFSSGYTEYRLTTAGRSQTEAFYDDIYTGETAVSSASYVSQPHNVSNAEEAAINITQASGVSVDLVVEYQDSSGTWVTGNSSTVTGAANHTLALPSVPSSTWRVRTDITSTVENPQFELSDESILFDDQDPALDGGSVTPSDGKRVTETPVQLNISVSDADFSTSQGDSVNVTFYDASDDSALGTTTLNANGTATGSFDDPSGGENTWYAIATDGYGNSVQSQTFSFQAPSVLQIRDEQTQELISGSDANVEVRFYRDDSNEVVRRNTTTGEISLDGLPLKELVVVADVEGYENRRIIIESIVEQSDIYLLNSSANTVQVEFELDDRTDQYEAESTRLFVEKSLPDEDGNNETETFQVIAGDFFGANNRYPVALESGSRYRLRVVNDDGDTRVLGSYTPTEPEITLLPIGNVELTAEVDGGTALQAGVRDAADTANHDYEIRVVYADLDNATDSFTLNVTDENGNQLRPETSETGPFGTYVETYPVQNSSWDPENNSATVSLTADRGGKTVTLSKQVGRVPGLFEDGRINSQILELMGIVSLVAIVGLLVIANPTIAAVVGVGYAGLLAIVGIVSIPAAAIGLAGSVAALFAAGGGDRT